MKKADIVIGANAGDEGKGTVVARLSKNSDNVLNVLTNGGSQRGHTVVTAGGSHRFQHFGSGTLFGASTYISTCFVLNPMQFKKEWDQLAVKPTVFRDPGCIWTTPYDMMANAIEEEARKSHGSCRMGIWNTMTRSRKSHIPFDAFVSAGREFMASRLMAVRTYYEARMEIPAGWRDVWNSPGMMEHYMEDCEFVVRNTIVASAGSHRLSEFDSYIFENGQGLMIGDNHRDDRERTPSMTGRDVPLLVMGQMGLLGKDVDKTTHYVTRPYLTRHGDGRLEGETSRKSLSVRVNECPANPYNDAQGEFRYGKLDIGRLKDRIDADGGIGKKVIELTHCDEMDRTEEFLRIFENVEPTSSPVI